jgi:four helix bundle protein
LEIEDLKIEDCESPGSPVILAGTTSARLALVNEQAEALKTRTKAFALAVIRLASSIPHTAAGIVIQRQLIRAATGAAANYRAACRSRSRSEFAARVAVALEEADEAELWLELLRDGAIVVSPELAAPLSEAHQLAAIFAQSRITAITSIRRKRSEQ